MLEAEQIHLIIVMLARHVGFGCIMDIKLVEALLERVRVVEVNGLLGHGAVDFDRLLHHNYLVVKVKISGVCAHLGVRSHYPTVAVFKVDILAGLAFIKLEVVHEYLRAEGAY